LLKSQGQESIVFPGRKPGTHCSGGPTVLLPLWNVSAAQVLFSLPSSRSTGLALLTASCLAWPSLKRRPQLSHQPPGDSNSLIDPHDSEMQPD
jgi:hypothetical protein